MNKKNEDAKLNITKAFSKVSGVYDSGRNQFFSDFGKIAAEKMQMRSDSTVLDIATGRGAFLFPASKCLGVSGKIVGIDLARGMIEQTSEEIRARGLEIDLHHMDAENLDFPDNAFDYVYCGFAIFFFPDLDRALSEILRVLKPGGRFGASTFFSVPEDDDEWFFDLLENHLKPAVKEEKEEEKNESAPAFDTAEGMTEIFQKAGFRDIETSTIKMSYLYTEDEWWDELFTHGAIRTMEKFTPEKLEVFKTDVYLKLKELKGPEGIPKNIWVLYSFGIK